MIAPLGRGSSPVGCLATTWRRRSWPSRTRASCSCRAPRACRLSRCPSLFHRSPRAFGGASGFRHVSDLLFSANCTKTHWRRLRVGHTNRFSIGFAFFGIVVHRNRAQVECLQGRATSSRRVFHLMGSRTRQTHCSPCSRICRTHVFIILYSTRVDDAPAGQVDLHPVHDHLRTDFAQHAHRCALLGGLCRHPSPPAVDRTTIVHNLEVSFSNPLGTSRVPSKSLEQVPTGYGSEFRLGFRSAWFQGLFGRSSP